VHRGPRQRGVTLIELLVVVGIVAILAATVTPAVRSLTGANARQAAGELAGSLRYLFDTAALRYATCRMALDLDGRAFWVECAKGAAAVEKDPEKAPTDEELARRFPDEEDADRRRLLAGTTFGAFGDRLAEKRELPGEAAVSEVRVEGRERPVTEGIAWIYAFPGGRAQRAFVEVKDGDTLFTVTLEPYSGRARVVAGRVKEGR
jgi:general secretion pathway protein H